MCEMCQEEEKKGSCMCHTDYTMQQNVQIENAMVSLPM